MKHHYYLCRKFGFTLAEVFHLVGKSRKAAFTLAEVLITLGIIGVVAALTMPVLISNHQKNVCVNRLKETYAKLSSSINFAQNQDGGDPEGVVLNELLEENPSATSTKFFVDNYIVPYFKIVKIVENKSLLSAGYPLYADLAGEFDTDAYYFSRDDLHGRIIIELANGTILYISTGGAGRFAENSSEMTIFVFVDINGLQKPNVTGKDLFLMGYSTKSKKLSMIWLDDKTTRQTLLSNCSKGAGTIANRACGALIQYDGWRIAPDYPW